MIKKYIHLTQAGCGVGWRGDISKKIVHAVHAVCYYPVCNKSHIQSLPVLYDFFITRSVRVRRDIKHIIIAREILVFYNIQATRPRACACIFHKTPSLMLYLIYTVRYRNSHRSFSLSEAASCLCWSSTFRSASDSRALKTLICESLASSDAWRSSLCDLSCRIM